MKLYTKCEEIPLYRFIEMYNGNLKSLVISGSVSDEELRPISFRIIEEYSNIVGNKNLKFAVSQQSTSINYAIKISLIEIILNMLSSGLQEEAFSFFPQIGVKVPEELTEESIKSVLKSIESILAHTKMKYDMLNDQIQKLKPKESRIDFTKERMMVSAHFKMHIDSKTYTAAEYGHLVRMMLNEIEQTKKYGK